MDRVPFQTIRRATQDDLDALRVLATAAAWGLCRGDYTPEQIATVLRYGMSVDRQMIADRTYYVVEMHGRIVAGGGWSYRAALMGNSHPDYAGGPLDVLDPAVHPARVRGFCVHPDFARRGLARRILTLCEIAAADDGFTRLELLASITGRRMYLACGFEDVEPVTNIFPNGVAAPAYRMAKSLQADDARRAAGRAIARPPVEERWQSRLELTSRVSRSHFAGRNCTASRITCPSVPAVPNSTAAGLSAVNSNVPSEAHAPSIGGALPLVERLRLARRRRGGSSRGRWWRGWRWRSRRRGPRTCRAGAWPRSGRTCRRALRGAGAGPPSWR